MNCVASLFPYLLHEGLTTDVAPREIINLHWAARQTIKRQYISHLRTQATQAKRDGRWGALDLILREIEQLTNEGVS